MSEVLYVGFWVRFVAFLIDSTAASIAIAPLAVTLIGEIDLSQVDLNDPTQLTMLLERLSQQLVVDLLFMGTIFILFWVFLSATPGKMIFGTTIVDAKSLGKATLVQNIIRYLGYFISMIPLGLGFVWIAIDENKRGWHDLMAGTVVIKGKPRPVPAETEE